MIQVASCSPLVHTDCGNDNGKKRLYWTLWVTIAIAAGLHVNTSIISNVTRSWHKKYLGFRCRCRSQCEQAFTKWLCGSATIVFVLYEFFYPQWTQFHIQIVRT